MLSVNTTLVRGLQRAVQCSPSSQNIAMAKLILDHGMKNDNLITAQLETHFNALFLLQLRLKCFNQYDCTALTL